MFRIMLVSFVAIVSAVGTVRADQYEMSICELQKAYEANEVRADSMHKGKYIFVTGTVLAIRRDFAGQPFLELDACAERSFFDSGALSASIQNGYEDLLAKFNIGDQVGLRCKCNGMGLGKVTLGDCTPSIPFESLVHGYWEWVSGKNRNTALRPIYEKLDRLLKPPPGYSVNSFREAISSNKEEQHLLMDIRKWLAGKPSATCLHPIWHQLELFKIDPEGYVKNLENESGWLGIMIQDVTPDLARAFGITGTKGAIVSDVVPNSLAERDGLRRGDIVQSLNGKRIENASMLLRSVAAMRPGSPATIAVIRDGKPISVKFTIRSVYYQLGYAEGVREKSIDAAHRKSYADAVRSRIESTWTESFRPYFQKCYEDVMYGSKTGSAWEDFIQSSFQKCYGEVMRDAP